MDVIITPDYQQRHPNPPMPVYRDYEITINLNELVEHTIPLCDIRPVSYTHLTLPTTPYV